MKKTLQYARKDKLLGVHIQQPHDNKIAAGRHKLKNNSQSKIKFPCFSRLQIYVRWCLFASAGRNKKTGGRITRPAVSLFHIYKNIYPYKEKIQ